MQPITTVINFIFIIINTLWNFMIITVHHRRRCLLFGIAARAAGNCIFWAITSSRMYVHLDLPTVGVCVYCI